MINHSLPSPCSVLSGSKLPSLHFGQINSIFFILWCLWNLNPRQGSESPPCLASLHQGTIGGGMGLKPTSSNALYPSEEWAPIPRYIVAPPMGHGRFELPFPGSKPGMLATTSTTQKRSIWDSNPCPESDGLR